MTRRYNIIIILEGTSNRSGKIEIRGARRTHTFVWNSDFRAFLLNGHPLSPLEFERAQDLYRGVERPFGPFPVPKFIPITEEQIAPIERNAPIKWQTGCHARKVREYAEQHNFPNHVLQTITRDDGEVSMKTMAPWTDIAQFVPPPGEPPKANPMPMTGQNAENPEVLTPKPPGKDGPTGPVEAAQPVSMADLLGDSGDIDESAPEP